MSECKVIAEIGCNHQGSLENAKKLVSAAAGWGCKFQKRNNRELLTEEEYNKPHPHPHNSYGTNYGEHRETLEFSLDQHQELKVYCENLGIVYSCSVWDVTSAKEIASLNPYMIKIPSAMNLYFPIYQALQEMKYNGEIHVSLGMTTIHERNVIFNELPDMFDKHNLVFYICTSAYPADNSDVYLLDINAIKGRGFRAGFSGHHRGIQIDIGAVALGAEYVERHFTLDRTLKGTDHAASLEPQGFGKLVRDVEIVGNCLKFKEEFSQAELVQRDKLKKIHFGASK